MENAIEINGLRKKFGNFGVEDVSFTLPKGFIMGFVGKNGAGKTTTIKAILNMLNRDSGEIKIFGKDNLQHEAEIKQKIGVVMDSPFYEQEWTLVQVGKMLKPFYPGWSDQKFNEMLKQFQLAPNKRVKELSRGMKMKIMVACALAHDPDLLILDEPTSGLDAVARDELLEILQSFISNENKSILFSTHITTDLEKIADYLTFIDNGKIVHSDTKDNMLEKYVIVKGGRDALTPEQKALIIGYHETKVNFDGITDKANLKNFPKSLVIEPCTMDELVVRFNKEGRNKS
ncbi:MAG: ABC transporter ATP-binding protein [Firmicutes bacterium]|nr:ABC transporter ATP-binding protein [Bacillota bacterium]